MRGCSHDRTDAPTPDRAAARQVRLAGCERLRAAARPAWTPRRPRGRALATGFRLPARSRRLLAARRTRQTWDLVAQELGATPPILYDERVYGASVHVLLDVVREVAEPVRTLLLIGHNPGLQELTLALAGEAASDAIERVEEKFPTSAIAVLTFEGSWPELAPASALLTDLAVPRGKKKS
ncbi:SixA phosphatase family protein [Streptosporangium lutulentum]